jgi:hypothetical protein
MSDNQATTTEEPISGGPGDWIIKAVAFSFASLMKQTDLDG